MRRALLTAPLLLLLLSPIGARAATVHVVEGAGFGHGIGMSQYGAYGLAQHGWGYARILRHYYTGTALGQAPSRPVRVLLQASDPYVRVRGVTRGPGGMRLEAAVTYVVRPARGRRLALFGRGGRRLGTFAAPLRVSRGGAPMRLLGPAIQGLTNGRYRGSFDLYPGSLGGVTVVNALRMDDYVRGVVASEVPSSWDEDVLRAQAVTARTYALATRKTGDIFDQYPDTRSQMYRGVVSETARTNAAVGDTAGEIVTHDGEVAATFYFSTSGGQTENIENSFIGAEPKPWLKSVEDPYDDISPRHRWTVRFSNALMGARLGSPGTMRRIVVLSRGESPRVVRARVYGSRGSRVLTGPEIRARLGLDDTWAYFTRVSSAQAGARSARGGVAVAAQRRLELTGRFTPPPHGRGLAVERRREGGRWTLVRRSRLGVGGRYRVAVDGHGTYRVRLGRIAGPAVRVR